MKIIKVRIVCWSATFSCLEEDKFNKGDAKIEEIHEKQPYNENFGKEINGNQPYNENFGKEINGNQPYNENFGKEINGNQPFNNQPYNGNQPFNNQPYNQPYNENQPFNNQPFNNQPFNNQPFNNQPFNNQPYNQPSDINDPNDNTFSSETQTMPLFLQQSNQQARDEFLQISHDENLTKSQTEQKQDEWSRKQSNDIQVL
jgi:hypothetical protein